MMVEVPLRDETGEIMRGLNRQPLTAKRLGPFVFRRPTVADLLDIGLRKSQALRGVPPADPQTAVLVEVFAVLPHQVEEAPDDWKWDTQYDVWVMIAIYQAYQDGLQSYEKHGKPAHHDTRRVDEAPPARTTSEDKLSGIGDARGDQGEGREPTRARGTDAAHSSGHQTGSVR